MLSKSSKTTLITGANRGIGLAIAQGLAAQNHMVLLGSRDLKAGQDAAATLKGDVQAVELDLADRDVLQNQLGKIKSSSADIDVLINNAAILEDGTLLEVAEEKFYASMRVNFEASYDLIRLIVPGMIERGYGRIVNVSSGCSSFADGLYGGAYAVSKAALNALTFSLAQSLPENVKVNAMCPGWVRTRMGGMDADRSPEQGAKTALWLATLPDDGPNGGFFRDELPIKW